MPSLGADMTEGTLLEWRVHPGDTVHKGDIVAEVDTAKAAIEIECFDDGVIGDILVDAGATVPVGTVLATIRAAAESANSVAAVPDSREHDAAIPAAPEPVTAPTQHLDDEPLEIRATPLIRKLAEAAGLDLAAVHGSAPGGRIVRADIDRAVAEQGVSLLGSTTTEPERHTAAASSAGSRHDRKRVGAHVRATGYARRLAAELGIELGGITGSGPDGAVRAADIRAAQSKSKSGADTAAPTGDGSAAASRPHTAERDAAAMRKLIAAAMTRSKQTVPHYYLSRTVDMSAALTRLRESNRQAPVSERVLAPALLLRAVALAARKVPELNGHWRDDAFHPAATVDLGMVVSLRGGGIIVPTIAGADRLSVTETMAAMRGAVARCRDGRLRSADAAPATITVTNLGDLGAETVYGVIAAPQVAIVGFGAISERPCAVDGMLGVRPQVTVTLSADHRASDGAVGSRLLNVVADLLQHPEEL